MKFHIDYFFTHPRRLFLLDGAGALLTAAILYGSYRFLSICFQLPDDVFALLFFVALFMAVFSFIHVIRPCCKVASLRLIGVTNILYALLTLSICFIYSKELASIAFVYFSFEILILFLLSAVEFQVADKLKKTGYNNEQSEI